MRSLILTLAAGLGLTVAAMANTVHYSASGSFDSSVPATFVGGSAFTLPTATWAFGFDVDVNPLVFPGPGGFDTEFSNWSYLLNGVDTGLIPTDIIFFCACSDGMFNIAFDFNDLIGFTGPEMFTGFVDSPTMSFGTFTDDNTGGLFEDGFFVDDPDNPGNVLNVQSNAGVVVLATPEPSTWGMLIAGGLALAVLRRRRLA